jgi:AcrR family transcriptional regulator
MQLVDSEGAAGADQLSIRKLAGHLGVGAMSLYNHVSSKDDLLDGLLEQWLEELRLPAEDLDPTDWVCAFGAEFRRAALASPHLFMLLLQRPLNSRGALVPIEALFAALGRMPLTDRELAVVGRLVLDYIVGTCTMAVADSLFGHTGREESNADSAVALLAEFPTLSRLAPLLIEDQPPEAAYDAGLRALLAGAPSVVQKKRRNRG